jgi:hypothetical protein
MTKGREKDRTTPPGSPRHRWFLFEEDSGKLILPQARHNGYLFLCLFFLSFFFRLWVAIFLSLRFLPQGT